MWWPASQCARARHTVLLSLHKSYIYHPHAGCHRHHRQGRVRQLHLPREADSPRCARHTKRQSLLRSRYYGCDSDYVETMGYDLLCTYATPMLAMLNMAQAAQPSSSSLSPPP